jgi:hypothetical protein
MSKTDKVQVRELFSPSQKGQLEQIPHKNANFNNSLTSAPSAGKHPQKYAGQNENTALPKIQNYVARPDDFQGQLPPSHFKQNNNI